MPIVGAGEGNLVRCGGMRHERLSLQNQNVPHATKNRLWAQLQVEFGFPVANGLRQLPTFIVTSRKTHDLIEGGNYCCAICHCVFNGCIFNASAFSSLTLLKRNHYGQV